MWLYKKDDHQELANTLAAAVAAAIKGVSDAGGPVVVIGRLEIQMNIAQGGGASVNVKAAR